MSINSYTVCRSVSDYAQVRLLSHILRSDGFTTNGRQPLAIAPETSKIRLLDVDAPRLDPGPESLPANVDARVFILGLDAIRQHNGEPRPDLVLLVSILVRQDWRPIVSGGRSALSRSSIENWLRANSIPWVRIVTRRPDEFRTELVIARANLNLLKADRLTPAFAIDSGHLVVASWRSNGIATFQYLLKY